MSDNMNFIVSFLGMMIGSGGFLRYMLSRYDKKKEQELAEQREQKQLEQKHIDELKNKIDNEIICQNTIIDNLIDLTCSLTQYRITRQVEKHSRAGMITANDRGIIEDMYSPYEALGKNHHAKIAMGELKKIPIVSEYPENIKKKYYI